MGESKEIHNENLIKPLANVYLYAKSRIFGPGIVELLKNIEQCKSLQEACKLMNMSYTKGWKIIKKLEKETNLTFIVTKIGGSTGGMSILSKDGEKILKAYDMLINDVNKALEKSYDKHMKKLFEK